MTPGRRPLRFVELSDVLVDAEGLLSRGHHTVGRWSIAQIFNHLSSSIDQTLDGFPGKPAPWIVRQSVGRIIRTVLLSTGRIMEGAPLPAKYRPAAELDPQAEFATLQAAIHRFGSSNCACQPHPFLGIMPREKWRRFHCIHCAHHLSFAVPVESSSQASASTLAI